MPGVISLVMLAGSSYLFARMFRLVGAVHSGLSFFLFLSAQVILIGYATSSLNRYSNIWYWLFLASIVVVVQTFFIVRTKRVEATLRVPNLREYRGALTEVYSSSSRFEKYIVLSLLTTVVMLAVLNLFLAITNAPNNADSMTNHLARMAYYFQQDSLDFFGANYWAQVAYPKNSINLLAFSFLASGHRENLTQLVQFGSYVIAILAVYGIATKIGLGKMQSTFSALVFALLIEVVLQSTTTQNDLLIAAFTGTTIYFFLAYRDENRWQFLVLAAMGIGLALGTKASYLRVLPLVGLVGIYVILPMGKSIIRQHARDIGLVMIFAIVFLGVTGIGQYVENMRLYGHPIGPSALRAIVTHEGRPLSFVILDGTRNIARFGLEFISLDGLPANTGMPFASSVIRAQALLTLGPSVINENLKLGLEDTDGPDSNFKIRQRPVANEDLSYWGIFGFGLVWIVVILAVLGFFKSRDFRLLAICSVLFLVLQSYGGPYDCCRGRVFIIGAIFAAPMVGVALTSRQSMIKAYISLVVLIGIISSVTAVTYRSNGPVVSFGSGENIRRSVLVVGREERLTASFRPFHDVLINFEDLVPKQSTVAVCFGEDGYEYPLFGDGLSRKLLPVNSFYWGLQAIPDESDFLIYSLNDCPLEWGPDDVLLGESVGNKWYLRKMGN